MTALRFFSVDAPIASGLLPFVRMMPVVTALAAVASTAACGGAETDGDPNGSQGGDYGLTATITSNIASGATLSGSVVWIATVSGTTPNAVDFYVDGQKRWTEYSSPYQYGGDPSGKLDTTTLANGAHTLREIARFYGGKTRQATELVTVSNGSVAPTFQTSLTSGMTITPPYVWTFTPGDAMAVQGTFWADGTALSTVSGSGPYSFTIAPGALSTGAHVLGHSWDLADGSHKQPPSNYPVTVDNPSTSPTGYDAAIAYSQTRPPFTPTRTVVVTSQSELRNAIDNIKPGDLIDCQGAFTVSGEFSISSQLSSVAVIDFKTGANAVKFTGLAGQNDAALYIPNASNLRLYGGDFTTQQTGGFGVLFHGGQNILFWGFHIHDAGSTGLAMFNLDPITGNDIQGEITNCGLNDAWDPHAEKGTGIHGANLADASSTAAFSNNRVALYVHDQPSGAGVEVGEPQTINGFSGNVLYLKAVNLTKVATAQVAGNAIQAWGVDGLGLDIKYLEATNCTGRAVDGEGFSDSSGGKGITVDYGVATNVCQNMQKNEDGISQSEPWDTRWGIHYASVTPAP